MSTRNQDFQKQEAIRSLWDLDGDHAPKSRRNKARARRRDRELTRALDEIVDELLEANPWLAHLDADPDRIKS